MSDDAPTENHLLPERGSGVQGVDVTADSPSTSSAVTSPPAQIGPPVLAGDTRVLSERSDQAGTGRRPRLPVAWLSAAVGLTIIVVVGVVVLAAHLRDAPPPPAGPLPVAAADQPGASGKYCTTLMSALPDTLSTLARRTLLDPEPGVAAWGDPAVVLRCGLSDPEELTCSSALTVISTVAWLELEDTSAETFIAADRAVRIAITLPPGSSTGPIQQISEIIAADLVPRDICSNGTLIPTDNG